jgi:hypothetical protein
MSYIRGAVRRGARLVARKMIEKRQQKSSDTNFLTVTLVLEKRTTPDTE